MSQLDLVIQYLSHLMIFKENYDYRGYRDAEPYDSEVSYQKCQPTDRVEVLLPTFITSQSKSKFERNSTSGGGERP